jgi:catechol 2,3-dioxygenase-like lactoylglutathione lyase family enzyme
MTAIQHVNLMVDDLASATSFYRDVIGLAPIDTPDLGFPAQFFAIGADQELHVNELDDTRPERAHFCLRVDDFDGVVSRAEASDAIETSTWGRAKRLPSGVMQLFVRDPAGNLIEIACDADQPIADDFFERTYVEPGSQG